MVPPQDPTTAGPLKRARIRLREALPSPFSVLGGAVAWGLAMGASALCVLTFDGWQTAPKVQTVVLLFAAGGVVGFPFGLFFARLLSLHRTSETAFAAAIFCFAIATIGFTALFFALDYRVYYAEWHEPAFTVPWAFQLVFTALVAVYQFAVLGLRFYLPVGFVALAAASLWFARQAR